MGLGAGRPQCQPRADCDGCAYLRPAYPSVSPVFGVGCPQFGSGNCVDLRWPPLRVALFPRRASGSASHSVGQGLTVTAAPTPDPHSPVCHLSQGAGRPQCRPRANCDGCTYFLTMNYSILAGSGAGRPQCRPRANCDGFAHPRTVAHSLLPTVSPKG